MGWYLCHLFFKILFKILNNTISDMKKITGIKQLRCISIVLPFLIRTLNCPPERNDGLPCFCHLYPKHTPTRSPGLCLTYIRGYCFSKNWSDTCKSTMVQITYLHIDQFFVIDRLKWNTANNVQLLLKKGRKQIQGEKKSAYTYILYVYNFIQV